MLRKKVAFGVCSVIVGFSGELSECFLSGFLSLAADMSRIFRTVLLEKRVW